MIETLFAPLEYLYLVVYEALVAVTGSYGFSLILLSGLSGLLVLPFAKWVAAAQKKEADIQAILRPQVAKIIAEEKDFLDRQEKIKALHQAHNYKPIYAIRASAGVLIQLPFFIAVYNMLKDLDALSGQSFLFLPDLAQPDGLLWGVNLLPILMTVINIVAALLLANFTFKDQLNNLIVATVFLVLLYSMSSALVFYWTLNNVWILCKASWARRKLSA